MLSNIERENRSKRLQVESGRDPVREFMPNKIVLSLVRAARSGISPLSRLSSRKISSRVVMADNEGGIVPVSKLISKSKT
jgi:hypothetical protein